MDDVTRKVRYEIFQFILNKCRPPTVKELASKSGQTEAETNRILHELEDLHHIKLYGEGVPSVTPIAMAHPFSHLPTPYVVRQGTRSWFANCAWCAFGLAAMLVPNGSVTVNVLLPSSGEHRAFVIENDKVKAVSTDSSNDYLTVFSAPPSKWWIDVRYACGTIQVCESQQEVDAWYDKRGFSEGGVLDLDTLWKLSKAWYANKHHYDYERKTPDEVKALFGELGMTSEYWTS